MIDKGLWGFRFENNDYIILVQGNASEKKLGKDFLDFIKNNKDEEKIEQIKNTIKNMKRVRLAQITKEDKLYLEQYKSEHILENRSSIDAFDWGTFFAFEERNFDLFLNNFKYIFNSAFLLESSGDILNAYIVNLDESTLEIYNGSNTEKVEDEDNRYSHLKNEFYGKNHFGVILKQKYTFDELDNIKNL